MNKAKFERIISEEFNKYEEGLNEYKRKYLIHFGILGGIFLLTVLCFIMANNGIAEIVTGITSMISFIAFWIVTVRIVKLREKKKYFINDSENHFYDVVYAGMIADEIGAVHDAEYIHKRKRDIEKYLGEIINKKYEKYSGNYNGKPFTFEFAKGEIITRTFEKDGHVERYKTEKVFTGADLVVTNERKADGIIKLFKGIPENYPANMDYVRMDDKTFPFSVFCEDELIAYKFLTPGVMANLAEFCETCTIDEMTVDQSAVSISIVNEIINMDIKIKFSKNISMLKEKYNFDYMYSLAHPEAEKVARLISSTQPIVRG